MIGMADWIEVVAIVVFTLTAAVIDVRSRRIPNWVTVPAALAGLTFHVVPGAVNSGFSGGWHGFLFALGGFAIGFGILFALMVFGQGGGGDVICPAAIGHGEKILHKGSHSGCRCH